MAGQLCGRCGGPLRDGRCDCLSTVSAGQGHGHVQGPDHGPDHGQERDAPTTVIPVIGAPELVRPYINPTEVLAPEDPEDGPDSAYGASVVPGIDAPHMVRSTRARVLAGQLVAPEDGSRAAAAPARTPGAAPVRGRGTRRQGDDGRSGQGRGRRAALIAAGALAVAGLGTAAALAPDLLGNSSEAQPQPAVTMALPTAAPVSATAGSPAPAVVRPTASDSARPQPTASATRTGSSTPSSTAGTPTVQASRGSATPSAPPSTSTPGHANPTQTPSAQPPGRQTLQLGDQGPAVATLQSELSSLWIDHDLAASGTYDSRTEQDVATFQIWYGVRGDPSGVFGPNSQARMSQLFHQHS